jgi:hypothetical protein
VSPSIQVLEWVTLREPLGLRFRDETTGTVVGGGLRVSAYPPGEPGRAVTAGVTRSGTFYFPRLPGLVRREDDLPRDFTVEVRDPEGRFVPYRLTVSAPAAASPPGSPLEAAALPLYSAPARTVPSAFAAIRAELRDAATGRPAAWAVLQASYRGAPAARTLADEKGRAALYFACPEPENFVAGSQPSGSAQSLFAQAWTIDVAVQYEPRPADGLPDLHATLAQRPGALWQDEGRTVPFSAARLRFGQETILRSRDRTGREMPVLIVTAAA